ncbi:MAG: beta-ketoacyl synthase N-terminal-like domain-containing protein, partial [Pseudomonadota bacterium]
MRRVVVTGLGMVSPLASGVDTTWSRLLAGQSAAGTITRFDAGHLATTYACEVPRGDGSDGTFNPDDWMEPKEQRKVDEFILYGMAAAEQAVEDAGWAPTDAESLERTGVLHSDMLLNLEDKTIGSNRPLAACQNTAQFG